MPRTYRFGMNGEQADRRYFGAFVTPIGKLTVIVDGRGVLKDVNFRETDLTGCFPDDTAVAPVREQIEEYFAGERQVFDLPLGPDGTPFQRAVWDGLLTIPFGQTLSYGQLAERVGRPGASRAVGAVNGANPIPIIIPCHRVIGSDRTLTGFGGGVPVKAALLRLEGVTVRGASGDADRRTRIEAQPSLF